MMSIEEYMDQLEGRVKKLERVVKELGRRLSEAEELIDVNAAGGMAEQDVSGA